MGGVIGIIGIHEHRVDCIVGIHPHEREKEQPLLIDLKIRCEFHSSFSSQNLSETIDYRLLAKLCTDLAKQKEYYLIEKYALDILDECMHHFHPLWVWVKVQKPSAIATAAYPYVEFERFHEVPACGR